MSASGAEGKVRIALLGAGRMGREVFLLAAGRADAEVVSVVAPRAPGWGPGATLWQPRLEAVDTSPELVIDFSLPAGTRAAADWCARSGVALLSGVTGLGNEEQAALRNCAEKVPVLWSPNLSVGVNLLADLVDRVAAVVDARSAVTIDDLHHRWKKDAPSGTALMLGGVIAGRRGGNEAGIAYESRREGEAVGEHRVRFQLADEEITLEHKASDRRVFARGALHAGLWLQRQKPGLHTAADWLASR